MTPPSNQSRQEDSPTSTLEQQQFMAGELPECRLEVFPGLGHGINVIHPEWRVQRVREFLGLQAHSLDQQPI